MLYKLNQRVFIGIAGMLTYPRLIANPHVVCNRVCFHSVRLAEGVQIERPMCGRDRSKQ